MIIAQGHAVLEALSDLYELVSSGQEVASRVELVYQPIREPVRLPLVLGLTLLETFSPCLGVANSPLNSRPAIAARMSNPSASVPRDSVRR